MVWHSTSKRVKERKMETIATPGSPVVNDLPPTRVSMKKVAHLPPYKLRQETTTIKTRTTFNVLPSTKLLADSGSSLPTNEESKQRS